MPVNDHLKWVEVKDFTKGLWSGADILMPADAFQTMQDCYPREGGGVRAFFKPSTTFLDTNGIVDATNERIIWLQPFLVSTGLAYLMLTKHITTGQQRGYHRNVGDVTWTNSKTFTAHGDGYANGVVSSVCTYNANGTPLWIVATTHNKVDGSEDGWWSVTPAGVWTRINATTLLVPGAIQYQARILGAQLNTLWWTDPGSTATPAAGNFLTIQSGNNDVRDIVVGLVSYAPNTLLVATAGSGWFMVEGDITDPVVREMGKDHNAWIFHKQVITEDGVIFLEPEGGIYRTNNMAANFEPLDENLLPFVFDTNMGFGYMNDFLFAPTGRVMDMQTKAWFTTSQGATSYNGFEQPAPGVNGISLTRSILVPQFQASGSILAYSLQERNAPRMSTYTLKSSPFRGDNGRLVHLREVQVGIDAFNPEATVTVTVNGTARTSAAQAGRNVISFLFSEHAEYLDVTIQPNSNTSAEAPVLEYFRVGTRGDSHQIHY